MDAMRDTTDFGPAGGGKSAHRHAAKHTKKALFGLKNYIDINFS